MVSVVLQLASAVAIFVSSMTFLKAIRPVLQNLFTQPGSVDLASHVDKEVAEASRAC